jgi:hypothetical protein
VIKYEQSKDDSFLSYDESSYESSNERENLMAIESFLMLGQSNMAGRGDLQDVSPIKNPHCFMLRMGRWQPMSEPVNPDRSVFYGRYKSGISPAASFADAYASDGAREVGLIPCADGGTRLIEWMPGTVLYDHAIAMASLACRSSNLRGILWHQGESDCKSEEDLLAYEERFRTIIEALRRDLGQPMLPILAGELSEVIAPSWHLADRPHRLNLLLRSMADTVPNLSLVSAQGLTLKPDGVHFDAVSCREFGRRYAASFVERFSA